MTIDVSLIPQNRVENLISKLSEIENNIGNIGTDITNNVVHKTGNETISGTKTFTSTILAQGDITLGTSTNTWGKMVQFRDTTGKRIARIQPMAIDTTKNRMGIWVNNADNTVEQGIEVWSDGTTYICGNLVKGVVKETWSSGTNWYRIWSDGWIEQGGAWGTNTGAWAEASVTYLKAYKDTNYQLFVQGNWGDPGNSSCKITSRSTAGFTGTYANDLYSVMPSWWYACGY